MNGSKQREHILIIVDSDKTVQERNIRAGERVHFGRLSSNQIVLKSGIVSKQHGYFEEHDGQLCVIDTGSKNGLIINQKFYPNQGKTMLYRLRDGDILRIDSQNAREDGVTILYMQKRAGGRWQSYPLFSKSQVLIGRQENCDIHLDSIGVSRRHAVIQRGQHGYMIRDCDSKNGVFINGEKIETSTLLREHDIIYIANSILIYTSGLLLYKVNCGGIKMELRDISREVRDKNETRMILNHVNLTIEPSEFVAIIGGSGAGKSTVMNAMSGFEQATSGEVFFNGIPLYKNHAVLKNMMGYVPQQDIIYENISLEKMLEYSAKMRIEKELTKEERKKRVQEVLNIVGLSEHKNKLIRTLSGGQKKRASIAVELLADPGLFFLDEPTSGLDPGTEANLMRTLNQLSKEKGKTIIMVTHTTQNLHLCDKILFMGRGGRVCFYGSLVECMNFFGTDQLTEIYNILDSERETIKWAGKYAREYGHTDRTLRRVNAKHQKPQKANFVKQFSILCSRYLTLIKNDRQRLLMIFLQPILIAFLIVLVSDEYVFDYFSNTQSILFSISCAGIWIGLFNSIQEICKERSILKREYMANLRLGAYVLSKFFVQFLMSLIQGIIITGILAACIGMPEEGLLIENLPFVEVLITMIITIFSSSAIGLIVSAVSKNSDKAMTVAPFLLIIQILFSGILFSLSSVTEILSYFTISKWSVGALGTISNLNDLPTSEKIPTLPESDEIFDFALSHLLSMWGILFIFVLVCMIGCMLLLKNVSKDSR